MALKRKIKSLDEVDAKIRDLYTKDGDSFVLAVDDEGDDTKAKLAEFRENNRKLFDQVKVLTDQMKQFEGIDPDRYKAAIEVLENIERSNEADALKKGDVESVVKRRLTAAEREWKAQLKAQADAAAAAAQERDLFRNRYSDMLIATTITEAVGRVGKVRNGALPDIRFRAGSSWKVNEKGELVPMDGKGGVAYNTKGEPLTPDEWAASLLKDAPHLFEPAQGGGGKGTTGTTANGKIVVDRRDPMAMAKHAEAIVKGDAIVQ